MDVYLDRHWKVHLIDFGVWGKITDPVLFTWEELVAASCDSLEFRVNEKRTAMAPSNDVFYGYPKDMLDSVADENTREENSFNENEIDLSSADGIEAFVNSMKAGKFQ
eukprot:g4264.t1